jgi:hypothetical protein
VAYMLSSGETAVAVCLSVVGTCILAASPLVYDTGVR